MPDYAIIPSERQGPPAQPDHLRGRTVYTRRRVLGLATAGAMGAAFGACGRRSATPEADTRLTLSTGPITIVPFLSGISNDMLSQWEEEIVAPYRQRRPNVKIDLIPQTGPSAERIEKLTTLIAAGTPPDLSEGPSPVRLMVAQHLLDPVLDTLVKRDKYDTKKYNTAHFELGCVHEGKIWAIPNRYGGNAICLACNTRLFAEAGIPLPPSDVSRAWTWEDFVSNLTRLTKKDPSGEIAQFGLAGPAWLIGTWPPLWQTDWIDADLKTIICDNPAMRDCYSKLADLYTRYHVLPQPGEAPRLFGNANLFNTGKGAVLLFPPTGWRTYAANAQVDYALAPLPKVVVTTPDMGLGGISLLNGGKHPADAWDFLKYLVDGSRFAKFIGLMPAALADIELWLRDQFKNVPSADPKAMLRIVETAPGGNTKLFQHARYVELVNVINPAMDDLAAGKVAPVAMLQALKPQLQAIIDKG